MALQIYEKFWENVLQGNIDIVNDTVKIALLDSNHTIDLVNDEVFTDVSADEVSGTNYTAGGITCPVRSLVANSNRLEVRLASDPVFTSITVTGAQMAVFYVDGDTKYLIGIHDEGSAQSPSAQNLPVNITDANNALFDIGAAS